MILQAVLAFTDYKFADGIFGSEFVGFGNFVRLFTQLPEFGRLVDNTVVISLLSFVCGFFPSLILAIMLFDLSSDRLRKVSQTIVYIPYFFSWVIIYGLSYGLLSNTGILNSVIVALGGESVAFLMEPKYIRTILMVTSIWKGVGWGTIIYLAAMQGIDTNLYDVAKLDGCGPIRRTFVVRCRASRTSWCFCLCWRSADCSAAEIPSRFCCSTRLPRIPRPIPSELGCTASDSGSSSTAWARLCPFFSRRSA